MADEHVVVLSAQLFTTVPPLTGLSSEPLQELENTDPGKLFYNTVMPRHRQEHFSESRVIVVIQAVNLGEKKRNQKPPFLKGILVDNPGERNLSPLVEFRLSWLRTLRCTLHSSPGTCFPADFLPVLSP